MSMQSGAVITPNKKNVLVDALNEELKNLSEKVRTQQLDEIISGSISNSRQTLQNLLNSVLERKGVITPDESDKINEAIEEAKKNRLRENYVLGMKKSVFWILGFVVIGGLIYWYNKRQKA